MESSVRFKEAYDVHRRHGAFFTGGHVEWTADAKHLFCQCEEAVNVINVENGLVVKALGKNEDDTEGGGGQIRTFALSSNNELVVTFHRDGLFRLWRWKDETLLKLWKSAHKGTVAKLAFGFCDRILASGGTDGCVRVWDLDNQSCINNLRGLKGVISVLTFHPKCEGGLIYAAAGDAVIKAWKLDSNLPAHTFKGHFSTVTALVFDEENSRMISCGRDKVLIQWDLSNNGSILHTIPTFECIEDMVLIPNAHQFSYLRPEEIDQSVCVATAGENGAVRVWAVEKRREAFRQSCSLVNKAEENGGMAITRMLFNEKESELAVVSADHNIIIHDFNSFECKKQFVGFSDEVLDVAFMGKMETHLAVATNSRDIKVYDISSFNCQLLKGHVDLVLTLCVAAFDPNLLVSGGKDNSVRLWRLNHESGEVRQLCASAFHSASVGCVVFSCLSASFLVSACEDACLKMWRLPSMTLDKEKELPKNLTVLHTVIAHQKTINGVSVAPNDQMIASASQDKTVKLWSADKLEPMGVLRGHRRGVWTVRFSPVDQILASASADSTIKIWMLKDLSCWKTLEGHNSSVLHLEFISRGMQLLTCGGDGLLKLWTIKSGECTASWDAHDGRIWAMAVSKDEKVVVTGGSDSALLIWQDTTEKRRSEAALGRESLVKREQMLLNLVQADQLLPALSLALSLDRPLLVLKIVCDVLKKEGCSLETTVKQLSPNEKEVLLKCAVVWNLNSRNCYPAQMVISILLDELSVYNKDLNSNLLLSSIEEMVPYTERHFQRLSQVLQDLHFIKHTVSLMKPLTN